jgi:hypothetical protein
LAASRLRRALDFTSDCAVVWFAVWTLAAYVGMLTGAHVTLLVALWVAGALTATAALVRFRGRSLAARDDEPSPAGEAGLLRSRGRLAGVGVVSGLTAAVLAAASPSVPWVLPASAALLSAACVVLAGRSRSPWTASRGAEILGREGDFIAFGVALCFAAVSLLIRLGNADDVFYVNRATAVAQLNRIPVLDVIFTHEEAARGGGAGLPVDSYSALQGAVAHVLGIQAPSVAYYVVPPVATFLAIWSLWRLLRSWAAQRVLLCFGLGSVFWIWSTQAQLSSGSYFLTRIWQGKVAFVAWLVPTIYLYLTRWLEGRDGRTAALLVAAGISAIGMTGSATFAGPLIFLTAVVAILACGDWRRLWAPLVAGAIPLGIGLGVLSRFPLSETVGKGRMPDNDWFYHELFGFGFVCVVAGAAIWLAPWLARAGPPARLASGIAVVVALLLAPGVLGLLHDVSGLTETLRRTLWLVPTPSLVGLLASAPLPSRFGRMVPIAATAIVACLLVAFGNPLWRSRESGRQLWHFPPAWKANEGRLAMARTILDRYDGTGPILVRKGIMAEIAILTTEPKTVNPRSLYLIRTRESQRLTTARLKLTAFVMSDRLPPEPVVRKALVDLQVGLVCLEEGDPEFRARRAVITPAFRQSFGTQGYSCFERRPDGPA